MFFFHRIGVQESTYHTSRLLPCKYKLLVHTIHHAYLIKFLLRILGAFTAAPTKEEPVNQMPHAAPTMESPKPKATPKLAKPYGDICVKTSDHPWLQNSDWQVFCETIVVDYCCFNIIFSVKWTSKTERRQGNLRQGKQSARLDRFGVACCRGGVGFPLLLLRTKESIGSLFFATVDQNVGNKGRLAPLL